MLTRIGGTGSVDIERKMCIEVSYVYLTMSVNMAGTASTPGLYYASYKGISGFVDLAIGCGLACFTRTCARGAGRRRYL